MEEQEWRPKEAEFIPPKQYELMEKLVLREEEEHW